MVRIEGPVATSEQLRMQVVAHIELGEWPAGERLPSVRRLAEELGLAPNTVAKAYRELEAGGWVHTAGRRGTVVAARGGGGADQQAGQLAEEYVRSLRGLGYGLEEAVAFVRRAGLTTD